MLRVTILRLILYLLNAFYSCIHLMMVQKGIKTCCEREIHVSFFFLEKSLDRNIFNKLISSLLTAKLTAQLYNSLPAFELTQTLNNIHGPQSSVLSTLCNTFHFMYIQNILSLLKNQFTTVKKRNYNILCIMHNTSVIP